MLRCARACVGMCGCVQTCIGMCGLVHGHAQGCELLPFVSFSQIFIRRYAEVCGHVWVCAEMHRHAWAHAWACAGLCGDLGELVLADSGVSGFFGYMFDVLGSWFIHALNCVGVHGYAQM